MNTTSPTQQPAPLPAKQELEQIAQKVLKLAVHHQQAGQLQDAENLYHAILEIQPNHPDANYQLGLLEVQTQRPSVGLTHFKAALEARPEQEQYWLSYIDALIQDGQAEIARKMLELGRRHGLQGDAVEKLAKRLEPLPQAALLSTTAQQQQPTVARPEKSEKNKTSLKDVAKAPSAKEMRTVMALFGQGRTTQLEILARSLTKRFPLSGFGWKALGAVLQLLGQIEEALLCMQKATSLMPKDAEAHCNLGTALQGRGRLTEAEVSLRTALILKPDSATAHNSLGITLQNQGRLTEAEVSLRKAITLQPDHATAHNSLGISLQNQGRLTEATESFRRALEIKADSAKIHSNMLFCMSHDIWIDSQQLYAAHLAFGEQFEAPLRADWQPHNNTKDPTRCLQIGFVSGDFYDHAVASFLEPVLAFLTKKKSLSLHAYYSHTREDTTTQRLHTYFSHWHAVAGLSDTDLANKIRADGIDILIDLSGHTGHNRLLTFARKPAPIQVGCIGYPGTTGLQAMDYRLCEQFWLPPGQLDWQFTEKLAYLPCGSIFQPSEHAPPVNKLPALENGYITFGSFNRPSKLNNSVIVLWSMLLHAVPTARMVLGGIPPDGQAELIQTFARAGIEQSRLTFFPRSNMKGYLAQHHQIDICLDTFPYGGGTTTAHASWMGVPTLTLLGETPSSRMGARFMTWFGLDDFIATSIEDFVKKGLYWADHLVELAAIRGEVRSRFSTSDIGQPEPFAHNLEVIFRIMWQRWCSDLPPASIEVIDSNTLNL